MYKIPTYNKTKLMSSNDRVEGESIETKVLRLLKNKEPIKDGAPEIFTERKDGVLSAYNIRTDRWEVAAEAMDLVARSKIAKSEGKQDPKVIQMKAEEETKVKKSSDSGAESTDGKAEDKSQSK